MQRFARYIANKWHPEMEHRSSSARPLFGNLLGKVANVPISRTTWLGMSGRKEKAVHEAYIAQGQFSNQRTMLVSEFSIPLFFLFHGYQPPFYICL